MRTMLRGKVTLLFMMLGMLLAIPAVAYAAELVVNAELNNTTVNSVTVKQGETANFTIKVNATGNAACGSTHTATVAKDFSLDDTAALSVDAMSDNLAFSAPGTGTNCAISGGPHTVAATISADQNTPVGTYTDKIVLSEAAGTTTTSSSNGSGGKLDDTTATKITVVVEQGDPPPPSDTTAPVITSDVQGTLGNNNWYTSDVSLTWSVVDNESSISSQSGCDAVSVTSDQNATDYTCTATSAGGTSSETVSIKRDATAPTISGSRTPAANTFGWNNGSVTVNYTCSDATSGMASCGPDETLSNEGADQSSTGTATDNAGNTANATVDNIDIDLTDPSVSLVGGPANNGSYYFGSVPSAPTCTASDALSGLDGACSVSGYGTTVGSHTVKAEAKDKAANTASDPRTYTVLGWSLSNFKAPVDMGMKNNAKAGSTVPLKFNVFAGTTELTSTSVVQTFIQKTPCVAGTGDDIEQYATGGTSLRYSGTPGVDGQFIFNWQTPKAAGSCYRVTLTTQDGSTIYSDFQLR